jgi:hypothetical protein
MARCDSGHAQSHLLNGHSLRHWFGSNASDSGSWPQSSHVRGSPGSGLGLGGSLAFGFADTIWLPPLRGQASQNVARLPLSQIDSPSTDPAMRRQSICQHSAHTCRWRKGL